MFSCVVTWLILPCSFWLTDPRALSATCFFYHMTLPGSASKVTTFDLASERSLRRPEARVAVTLAADQVVEDEPRFARQVRAW
jgi:hypothetical protein